MPYLQAGLDVVVESADQTDWKSVYVSAALERLRPSLDKIQILVITGDCRRAQYLVDAFDEQGDEGVEPVHVCEGADIEADFEALQDANVVCATPKRLLQMIGHRDFYLDHVSLVIFDRFDEFMVGLDADDVARWLEPVTTYCNYIATGAELSEPNRRLFEQLMLSPQFFSDSADSRDRKHRIQHYYFRARAGGYTRKLIRTLETEGLDSTVLVGPDEAYVKSLSKRLERLGYDTAIVRQRTSVPDQLRRSDRLAAGQIDVLLVEEETELRVSFASVERLVFASMPESLEQYLSIAHAVRPLDKSLVFVSPMSLHLLYETRINYGVRFREYESPDGAPGTHGQWARVEQLVEQLEDRAPIPYGRKLPASEQFLKTQKKQDQVKLVAQLFELADAVYADETLRRAIENPASYADGEVVVSEKKKAVVHKTEVEAPDEKGESIRKEAAQDSSAAGKPKARSADNSETGRDRDSDAGKTNESTAREPSGPQFETEKMYINLGTEQFRQKDDLLQEICHRSGFTADDFGDVSMLDNYSFVQVRENYFYDIVNVLNHQDFHGEKHIKAEPARS